MKKKTKVVVLKGGFSDERNVSLLSGKTCAEQLRLKNHFVIELDVKKSIVNDLKKLNPSVVFNCLHGTFGEDGTIQAILEWLEIPYTHSGVFSSSLAMNKHKTKEFISNYKLPVAKGSFLSKDLILKSDLLAKPFVIKPNKQGSSLGVEIFKEVENRENFLKKVFSRDLDKQNFIIEEFIPGRELTTVVVNKKSIGVTEIIVDDWYDYEAKYIKGKSKHEFPAKIPKKIENLCKSFAEKTHNLIGCRGITRTDFRWDPSKGTDGLIILEINTQPGMTSTSLVPEQVKKSGSNLSTLCEWILEDASCLR